MITDKKEDFKIVVDAGFDALKIVINGEMLLIPNAIIDTSNISNIYYLGERKEGFIISHYIPNRSYLIGNEALILMNENKQGAESLETKEKVNDSFERFLTTDFEIMLMSSIAYALVKYCEKHAYELESLTSDNIWLGVALPYDAIGDVWESIRKKLVGDHQFSLETESGQKELRFSISDKQTMGMSQVIAALLGAALKDDGSDDLDSQILKKVPVLVTDGGYKTFACCVLTSSMMVTGADSSTEYAMNTIHKEVAKELNETYNRTDIHYYHISGILKKGGILRYIDDQEKSQEINVKELINNEIKIQAQNFIRYINKTFNNLMEIQQILMCGGTGAAYYPYVATYAKEKRAHLDVTLANYKFMGREIDPVYAIAVGLYKTMLSQMKAKSQDK